MKRYLPALLAACFLLGAAPRPSPSSSPSPRPSATPITAFSGTGRLTAQAVATGKTIGAQADVAVWARPGFVRFDLQKLSLSSADPSSSALLTQLLPTGGVTAVFNQKTQMVTIWSSQTQSYYSTKLAFPHPKPAASPKPKAKATPAPGSPVTSIFKALDSMTQYDVYSSSFELTGHQPVNGHMASLFHFVSKTQKHGAKLETVNGDLALADDLSGIPLQLAVDASGSTNGNLKIDLLTFHTATPDMKLFAVPAGYKKAKSILEVVMHK